MLADEGDGFGAFGPVEPFHLVERHEQRHRPVAYLVQQVALGGRQRRVGGQYQDRGVHGGQYGGGFGGVVREHRPGTGGVDDLDAAGQERRVQVAGGPGNPQRVVRVVPFGNQQRQVLGGSPLAASIQIGHFQAFGRAVPQLGGQRRDRRDAGGQQLAAQQRVDQRALAALGLTDDQYPEPLLPQPIP